MTRHHAHIGDYVVMAVGGLVVAFVVAVWIAVALLIGGAS